MHSVWLNDRLVPEDEAVVSVFDHGFLYGDGIYESLLGREGVVLKLGDHLDRLRRSAALISLRLPRAKQTMTRIIYKTMDANGLRDAYIRISVSRGPGLIGLDPALCPDPTLVVVCRPFVPYAKKTYRDGVRIMIPKTKRNLRDAINPEIKSLNFLNNILAKIEAVKAGAFEAVMLNHEGYLTEGTISNLFLVINEVLLTPSVGSGILGGITRQTILDIAERRSIPSLERHVSPEELFRADEVFLTNTTMGVMPVGRADRTVYGKKRPLTDLLSAEYEREVKEEIVAGRSA